MLYGVDAEQGAPGVVMPAFSGLSDADLAGIAGYLRATRTSKAPWPDLERTVATVRAGDSGTAMRIEGTSGGVCA